MRLSVLKEEQLTEMLEMYQRRVAYNIAKGTTQWQPEEVVWETLSKDYVVEDFRVLTLEGKIIAAMALVDVDELYWPGVEKGESLYLHKICVDPKYEGHEYGDVMVSMFIQEGRELNKKDVRLDVRAHKKALVDLYERNGFILHEELYVHKEFKTRLYKYTFKDEKKEAPIVLEDTMWPNLGINHQRNTVRAFAKKGDIYAFLKIRGSDEFQSRNHYESIGGGIEKGESALLALHREVYEELGYLCKVTRYLGTVQDAYHLIHRTTLSKFYEVELKEELSHTSYTEIEKELIAGVIWIPKKDLINELSYEDKKGIDYLVQRRDYTMALLL